ncbi:DAK2 domain-containing protein [Thermocrispum agreste]|uniref:DAK2 domain-containing protein n=1 Tax=Thermocrispum agreste TaxID=37925 RepID=UPI0003FB9959|nr:DAK2 domain-containing protein [Thermocrispum agreste]
MSTGGPAAVTAAAVAAWADAAVRALQGLCAELDAMNVFPVADSDTGSNMLHTFTAARDALLAADDRARESVGTALATMAHAAVSAARGNSGVILSQFVHGLAEACGDRPELDASGLAKAFENADSAAASAVVRPVEGTMLSVLHAAAEAAGRADTSVPADVASAAADAAAEALARTPDQLAVLAEAGVVDAGGRGLLAVLDELAAVLSGRPSPARGDFRFTPRGGTRASEAEQDQQPWEVMYLLEEATEDAVTTLKEDLSAIGDSVTIAANGAGTYAVHVHCADIGAAIEAGMRAGKPHQVRVESLTGAARPRDRSGSAVLAVVCGAELAELCQHEGVTVLDVRAGHAVSVEVVEQAIDELAADHVTVLAASRELTVLAEDAAERARKHGGEVVVVPCASPVQVLAAIAVHDPERRSGDNVVAMAEAAASTRRGELKRAEQDAITWVGRVAAGDLVGFADDEVVLIAPADRPPAEAATELLDLLLASGGELVTVLLGASAPAGMTEAVTKHMARVHPEVELSIYPGGQTDSVLSLGVE